MDQIELLDLASDLFRVVEHLVAERETLKNENIALKDKAAQLERALDVAVCTCKTPSFYRYEDFVFCALCGKSPRQ